MTGRRSPRTAATPHRLAWAGVSLSAAAAGSEQSAAGAFRDRGRGNRMGRERGAPAFSKTAAVAIATRFTADVLSWDEDAPEVR